MAKRNDNTKRMEYILRVVSGFMKLSEVTVMRGRDISSTRARLYFMECCRRDFLSSGEVGRFLGCSPANVLMRTNSLRRIGGEDLEVSRVIYERV